MEQELAIIELMNRLLAEGKLNDPKYHPIHVARIKLDRDLDYSSKLDRRPAFLKELMDHGNAQALVPEGTGGKETHAPSPRRDLIPQNRRRAVIDRSRAG